MVFEEWVEGELKGLDINRIRIYVVSCVERVCPIIQEFGEEISKKVFEEVVLDLKEVCNGGSSDINRLQYNLNSLPEAYEDDCYKYEFFVMEALGIVYEATKIINDKEIIKNAMSVCMGMLDLSGGIDAIIEDGNIEPFFEEFEENTQRDIIDILKSNKSLKSYKEMKFDKNNYMNKLESLMPVIRKVNGWEKNSKYIL